MIREDPTFFLHILFSDETSFYNNGHLNRHNCPQAYWSTYVQFSLDSTCW